jgi:uncharacterized protein (DUF608 family)
MKTTQWPVLTRYDRQHLTRIALPLGGIGTGTVSLGGRGDLRDWEIVNRPAKGFVPANAFFAVWAKREGDEAVTRALEGPIDPVFYEGDFGCKVPNHNLPRFRDCSFEATYPFGRVLLSDADVPLRVAIEAFNPLIPGDADRSGIPVAVLRFVLTNTSKRPVEAAVCGNLQNFIGRDGSKGESKGNVNKFRSGRGLRGIFMHSNGVDANAEQWGTLALSALATSGVTHRTAWEKLSWGDSLLDFWDDFSANGQLENRDAAGEETPMASLCARFTVAPQSTQTVTFLLTWHFPNRNTWTPSGNAVWLDGGACAVGGPLIGNYYTTQYTDAWDVAQKAARELPQLEVDTLKFVRAFCDSGLPHAVKEAALFNLSTLRTQTCFRTPDGYLYGWEGCADKNGCCFGSCTHVWNYEQATAFLFGDLARGMREIEFGQATDQRGKMSFRVHLPLSTPSTNIAAADGQMGCIMKLYREWQLCGDDKWLQGLWPQARKALEFCWIEGGWDADRDGVMEGCQHNTMDVEYFGPNPQMQGWYLGALRAAEEMARHIGDHDFAATCRDRFERGSRWTDEHLFNNEYYEHEIRPPHDASAIAPGLRHDNMGAHNLDDPELQLGAGCLVDQLVGQYMAHICGLGYLLEERNVQRTLRSIMKYNFKPSLHGHFNHLRSFALGDEAALLMCSYPRGRRPRRPFPYYNEVMTGFEYTAAVGMIYEGQGEAALKCIEAIRGRYDGRNRSPFDEAECGHHYARAMASWGAVVALTGFEYSAVDRSIRFAVAQNNHSFFWSNGSAWGTAAQRKRRNGTELEIVTLHGTLKLREVSLSGLESLHLPSMQTICAGQSATFLFKTLA